MAKDKKNKRRILKGAISFLSLCPRGANQIQTMYKAEDGGDHNISITTLIKGDISEQGELLAVVYAPETSDCDGDVASEAVIKEMAYSFSESGKGIDIKHNEEVLSKNDIFVAENFIIQKNDPRFADTKDYDGNVVDATGGWGVVLKVNNEDLRKQYRDGDWGGISMGGLAITKPENSNESVVAKLVEAIAKAIKPEKHKTKLEKSMNDADKKEIVTDVTKSVLEALNKAEAEKLEKAKKDKESEGTKRGLGLVAPILKANPTELDIDQFAKNKQIFDLSELVDPTDMDSVRKYQQHKQNIVEGKEVSVAKSTENQPFNAFETNQGTLEVKKTDAGTGDELADALFEQLEKEEKAKVKLAV